MTGKDICNNLFICNIFTEVPVQFLHVHYEENGLPHDWSKGNIQVRIYKVFKIVRYTLTISIHVFSFP